MRHVARFATGTVWLACLCLMGIACPQRSEADGIMISRHDLGWEGRNITEVDQKAALFFDANTEDLVISPGFRGSATEFAWVVPVPSRPRVSIVKGALFHDLARLVFPEPPPIVNSNLDAAAQPAMRAKGVEVLERKTEGAYDVTVLRSDDPSALLTWLKTNKYQLPAAAREPMQWYIDRHWTFVAARVKTPGIAHGLATGTLAPLRLRFPTSTPVYPMRLSSANANPFNLLVYVVIPDPIEASALRGPRNGHGPAELRRQDAPGTSTHRYYAGSVDTGRFPTLGRFTFSDVNIYVERRRLQPSECRDDFRWVPQVASSGTVSKWKSRR